MQVYLDDAPIDGTHDSISAAIEAAKSASEAQGNIVIQAEADGAPMPETMLAEPPADVAGVKELRFTSTPRSAFLRVTLTDAAEALESAVQDQTAAAHKLQAGHIEEAVEPMNRALGVWTIIRDVVDKVAQLTAEPVHELVLTAPDGSTIQGSACIAGLAGNLESLRQALGSQDWSAVSDLLEYDLTEQAASWRMMLAALAERA